MTPAELCTAAGAMRAAAAAMGAAADRYGDGARAAREPIGALQTVAAGPDVDRLTRQGRRFVDLVDDVPGLLHTAATELLTFARDTDRTAEEVGRLDARLAELRRQRMLAAGASSLSVDADEAQRIEQDLRVVAGRRDQLLGAWRASADRVARGVGDVDRQLASVTTSLDAAALGRAAVAGIGVAHRVTAGYGVLDRSGVAARTLGERHRAARLINAQHALSQTRWTASPHRPRYPGLDDWGLSPQAQRANDARRTRQAAAAIPRAEASVAAAQRAVDTNQPLTRASARASQLWNSPVRQKAGRLLGRTGHIFGAATIVGDLSRGNYANAGLTALSMAATAAVATVPVAGAAVVIGVAIYQNRDELASAGRWVKGKIKGLFSR